MLYGIAAIGPLSHQPAGSRTPDTHAIELERGSNFRITSDPRRTPLSWDAPIADSAASCWTGPYWHVKGATDTIAGVGLSLAVGTKARAMMNSQDAAPARFATRARCRPCRFEPAGMWSVISSDAKKGVAMFKKTTLDAKDKASAVLPSPSRTAPEPRPAAAPAAPAPEVTREAIAKLAFQNWQKRGCPNGEDQRDWYEAERELKSSQATKARRG
jgi:hypothetical protein